MTTPSVPLPAPSPPLGAGAAQKRQLVLAGVVAFGTLGLSAALLGPELPQFRARLDVDVAQSSWLLAANSAGSVLGVLIGGWAQYRRRARRALIGGSLALALGALGLAWSASWALVVAAAGMIGIGFGVLDFGLLVVLASGFAQTGASVLNTLSAMFSIAAIAGPVLVAATPHALWPVFGLLAVLAGALAVLWSRTPIDSDAVPEAVPEPGREPDTDRRPDPGPGLVPASGSASGGRSAQGVAVRLAIGFGLLLALYVSLENGVGAWETTYLREASGFSQSAAASATSLFWVAITAGRLLGGWLARRTTVAMLVSVAVVGAAGALVVAALPGLGLVGFTLTGIFLAPIFPTAFAWFSATRPSAVAMTSVFAASVLGPTLSAPVIGAATQAFGAGAIPMVLAPVALLDVAVVAGVHGWTRPQFRETGSLPITSR